MVICHLVRDSSLTITEKISTAVIPATTVTRINRKGNSSIEEGRHSMDNADKALEARINEIETRLNMFQAMVMREKVREEGLYIYEYFKIMLLKNSSFNVVHLTQSQVGVGV